MKRFTIFIIMACLAIIMMAVPANRKPFVAQQSDGTFLNVVLQGDESLHFYTTIDGKYLVREANGDFSYATFSSEEGFISTKCLAHDISMRGAAEATLLASLDYGKIGEEISRTHKARSAKFRNAPATRAASSITPKGEVLVPVLLVEFSDVKFSFSKEDIDKLLNEPGYKYDNFMSDCNGSARDYFIAQSDSQFRPRFVTTEIVTLPQPTAYYGGNGTDGEDKNPLQMIRHGIALADSLMDMSQFDNNGDGEVEFVYCIYAGYSEANGASENTIWPHQWQLTAGGGKYIADGVLFDVYACSSELNITEEYEEKYGKWLAGIGTLCHEFSHCLGLHDVYDVKGNSGNWCMDEWDLMDQGNYVGYGYLPVGYNSYQKEVCGWKSLEILEKKGRYSMEPQSRGGAGYKIVNDANPNEYFILENRKKEGWDQGLAAEGILIIHVDYNYSSWASNSINTVAGHPRFHVVSADNDQPDYYEVGYEEFYKSLAGDLWPGPANNTSFTDTSIPASKVYTGEALGKPVTDMKYENGIASFNFMGGIIDTPVAEEATEITSSSFVANWKAVEGADRYIVELYSITDAAEGEGDSKNLLKEDFLKCSSSNTEIKSGNFDNYMSVTGWNGSNIYSESGAVRVGSSNNPGTLTTPVMNARGNVAATFRAALYNTKDTGSKIKAEFLDKNQNILASTDFVPAANYTEVKLEGRIDGDFTLLFSTDGSTGKKRVKIDDVTVSTASSTKSELTASITTAETSHRFENLAAGKYIYKVKALGNNEESAFSNPVEVLLGSNAITVVPDFDGIVEIFSISGIKLYRGTEESLPELPSGIYIMKSSTSVKKFVVK